MCAALLTHLPQSSGRSSAYRARASSRIAHRMCIARASSMVCSGALSFTETRAVSDASSELLGRLHRRKCVVHHRGEGEVCASGVCAATLVGREQISHRRHIESRPCVP